MLISTRILEVVASLLESPSLYAWRDDSKSYFLHCNSFSYSFIFVILACVVGRDLVVSSSKNLKYFKIPFKLF